MNVLDKTSLPRIMNRLLGYELQSHSETIEVLGDESR
jgi:hypothetical protein